MLDEYNFSEGVRGKYALRTPGGNKMTKKEIIELFRECFKEAREAIGDNMKVNSTSDITERIALHLFDTVITSEICKEVSERMFERMDQWARRDNLLEESLNISKRITGIIESMTERLTKLEEGKK